MQILFTFLILYSFHFWKKLLNLNAERGKMETES